jgi:hypothetical protein
VLSPPSSFRSSHFSRHAPAYFSLRIFCEDKEAVLAHSPALFAMEPHDILPVSIFSFSGILGYFPTHDCRGCLSSACFMLPGALHSMLFLVQVPSE